MNLEGDKRLNIQLRLDFSSQPTGEARQAGREDIESPSVVSEPEPPANPSRIMEEVCERANLKEALRQVRGNKGSAGIDRMTVDQLGGYLKQHWPAIREQLLIGTYKPKPVRRVQIPKPELSQPLGSGEPDDLRSSGNGVIVSAWHHDPQARASGLLHRPRGVVAYCRRSTSQCFCGYRLTNPLRFGIATFGRVSAFIASFSPITLLRARIKAVSA